MDPFDTDMIAYAASVDPAALKPCRGCVNGCCPPMTPRAVTKRRSPFNWRIFLSGVFLGIALSSIGRIVGTLIGAAMRGGD